MTPDSPKPATRRALWLAGTVLVALVAIFLCLQPKPENDLFFELRTGTDILARHHLPRFETYSWSDRGRRWDVPEWGAFVLYALAFRAGGYFGTWLLMALLTVGAAAVVWFPLARRLGPAWAFAPVTLMLLGISPCIQERPYAFTYLLLPVGLWLTARGRAGSRAALWGLLPLCAVWTNLHQGVVVLVCVLLAYAVGDAATGLWVWRAQRADPPDLLAPGWEQTVAAQAEARNDHWRQAARMGATALACAGAVMLSPYGVRVYWNVFITVRDRSLMTNVTEWNPITVLPAVGLGPFALLLLLVTAAFLSSRRRNLGDALVLIGLLAESVLHARNIALFAIGGVVIGAPYFEAAIDRLKMLSSPSPLRRALLGAFALLCVTAIGLGSLLSLRRAAGPQRLSPEGLGEAVARLPRYPAAACAALEAQALPPDTRLLNDFETGGYLMWRLPRQPVFIDGRLDVHVGRTFDDNLILARDGGSPGWQALVQRYGFDAVLTANWREAQSFVALPGWRLVYQDPLSHHPRYRLLRRG